MGIAAVVHCVTLVKQKWVHYLDLLSQPPKPRSAIMGNEIFIVYFFKKSIFLSPTHVQ